MVAERMQESARSRVTSPQEGSISSLDRQPVSVPLDDAGPATFVAAELLRLASHTMDSLADVKGSIGRTLAQIPEVLERETDPEKIRNLLSANECLTALLDEASPTSASLDQLMTEFETGPQTEAQDPGNSASASGTGGTIGVAPCQAEIQAQTKEVDLDALIGSTPAEQQAARDADIILQVGDMVRSARLARGLTQTDLAARTGVTQPHISDIERGIGRIGPTVVTLRRLMNALGYDLAINTVSVP